MLDARPRRLRRVAIGVVAGDMAFAHGGEACMMRDGIGRQNRAAGQIGRMKLAQKRHRCGFLPLHRQYFSPASMSPIFNEPQACQKIQIIVGALRNVKAPGGNSAASCHNERSSIATFAAIDKSRLTSGENHFFATLRRAAACTSAVDDNIAISFLSLAACFTHAVNHIVFVSFHREVVIIVMMR